MSFTDEARTQDGRAGGTCKVSSWLENADVTDHDLFAALEAGVSKMAIWRAMRSHGFPEGPNSAKRHLSGQCKCHS